MGGQGKRLRSPVIRLTLSAYKIHTLVWRLVRVQPAGGALTCPGLTGLEQICLDIR